MDINLTREKLNTEMTWETNSHDETFLIGKAIAEIAEKGDIFCLNGELGAGKTVFAKGFATGLSINDEITSPTFTILNIYIGRLEFYHFDLYRLEDGGNIDEMGFDEYIYASGVSLIEWPVFGKEILPQRVSVINISRDYEKGDDYRIITYNPSGTL